MVPGTSKYCRVKVTNETERGKKKKSFCISLAVFKQNNNLKYQGKKQVAETEFKIVPFPQSRGGERGFPDPQIKQLTTLTTTCYVLPSLRSTGFLKTRACQTEVEDEESRSPLSSKKSTQLKHFFLIELFSKAQVVRNSRKLSAKFSAAPIQLGGPGSSDPPRDRSSANFPVTHKRHAGPKTGDSGTEKDDMGGSRDAAYPSPSS